MEYLGRINAKRELMKIARGQKSKLPTAMVVDEVFRDDLRDYPDILREIASAFETKG